LRARQVALIVAAERAREGGVFDAKGPDYTGRLADLDFGVDIGSREQISRDYASRIRLDYLSAQNMGLLRQTQFADTKASALLALIGLVAGRIAFDLSAASVGVAEIALFAVKGLVLALCLLVLLPRYPSGPQRAAQAACERFSWVALTAPGQTAKEYAAFIRTAEVSQLQVSAAYANAVVAQVLLRKFRLLRAAFLVALLDVGLTILYLLGAADALALPA
jgi:hypothetical protein